MQYFNHRGERASIRNERGSVLPLAALLFAALAGAGTLWLIVGRELNEMATAQNAADAAALAGALHGRASAAAVATANGAMLDGYEDHTMVADAISAATGEDASTHIGDVTVSVTVDGHRRSARAQTRNSSSALVPSK